VVLLTAGLPALVAVQYRSLVAGPGDVASLAALAENPAVRTLFGPPVGLDDAGGFTVWRTGTVVAVLLAVWALLVTTRVSRGEEDAGRAELLLAGSLRLPAVLLRQVVVLTGVCALAGLALAGTMAAVGTRPAGALTFGAATGLVGGVATALGALTGQLAPDRRVAATLAGALVAVALLLRMVADGVPALAWVSWLTPFGLASLVSPFTADRWPPLVALLAMAVGLVALALVAARSRDLGAGLLAVSASHGGRPGALRSLPRLALRRSRRSLYSWAAGLGLYFLLLGALATSLTGFLRDNPRFAELAGQAGFGGLATVEGYVAALFPLLAVPVGAFVATRAAATAEDEDAGRLVLLLALPVARRRWVLVEVAVLTAGAVALLLTAGASAWLGARLVDAPLPLGGSLAGALSVLPVTLLCLGAAVAALGWVPSAVLPVGVLPAAGGYLLLVLVDTFGWPDRVRGLSPFDHLAAVPAQPWDGVGAAGLLLVAVLLTVLGLVGYERRDLRG
jgi:ABC-2 type transport system permease protein